MRGKRGLTDLVDVDTDMGSLFDFGSLKRTREAAKMNVDFSQDLGTMGKIAVPLAPSAALIVPAPKSEDADQESEKKHRKKKKDKSEKSSKKRKEGEKSERSSRKDKSEKSSRKDKSEKSSRKDKSEKKDKKKTEGEKSDAIKLGEVSQVLPNEAPTTPVLASSFPEIRDNPSKLIPPAPVHSTIIPPSVSKPSDLYPGLKRVDRIKDFPSALELHDSSPPELSDDDLADDSVDDTVSEKTQEHKKRHKKHSNKEPGELAILLHPSHEPTVNSQPTKTLKPITEEEESTSKAKIQEDLRKSIRIVEQPSISIQKDDDKDPQAAPQAEALVFSSPERYATPSVMDLQPPNPTHEQAVLPPLPPVYEKPLPLATDSSTWRLLSRSPAFKLTPSVFIPIHEMHASISGTVRGMPLPDLNEICTIVPTKAITHFFESARASLTDTFRIRQCDTKELGQLKGDLNSKPDSVRGLSVDGLSSEIDTSRNSLAKLGAGVETSYTTAQSLKERVDQLKTDVVQETDNSLHFGRFIRQIFDMGFVYVLWFIVFLLRIILSPFLNDESLPPEMTLSNVSKRLRRAKAIIRENRRLEEEASANPDEDNEIGGLMKYVPGKVVNFFSELTE